MPFFSHAIPFKAWHNKIIVICNYKKELEFLPFGINRKDTKL